MFRLFAILSLMLLALIDSAHGDITVHPPSQVIENSWLTIMGQPGIGQTDAVAVTRFDLDKMGRPKISAQLTSWTQKLNETKYIVSGHYMLSYSRSITVVTVEPGTHREVRLQQIHVPKITGTIEYEVFWDSTERQQLEKLALYYWIHAKQQAGSFLDRCPAESGYEAAMCNAFASGDYKKLLGPVLKSDDDGYVQVYGLANTREFYGIGRISITDPKDGTSVSVFPGIYGISWRSADGVRQTTLGHRVD